MYGYAILDGVSVFRSAAAAYEGRSEVGGPYGIHDCSRDAKIDFGQCILPIDDAADEMKEGIRTLRVDYASEQI